MTKLVQPNVLRTYQSGEQYADKEFCLYNGAPVYTNIALAQGVAGTAGNFTNISGNTFSDSLFRIQDNGDATKQIAFEASGISTGTTRNIIAPNFDTSLSAIRRRISTSTSVTNYLLDNTETYIEIDGGTTINVYIHPPYTQHCSGLLINKTNTTKTVNFVYSWTGQDGLYLSSLTASLPESGEVINTNSSGPGSSGNTSIAIYLYPGETRKFIVSGSEYAPVIQLYSNARNYAYGPTFKIVKSLVSGADLGVNFDVSSILITDKIVTMPNFNVNLGDLQYIGHIPNVATTNSNDRTGTLTAIVSGQSNTVSGTGNVILSGKNNSATADGQVIIGGQNITHVITKGAISEGMYGTTVKGVTVRTKLWGSSGGGPALLSTTGSLTSTSDIVPVALMGAQTIGSDILIATAMHTIKITGSHPSGIVMMAERRVNISNLAGTVTVDTQTIGTDYTAKASAAPGTCVFLFSAVVVSNKLEIYARDINNPASLWRWFADVESIYNNS